MFEFRSCSLILVAVISGCSSNFSTVSENKNQISYFGEKNNQNKQNSKNLQFIDSAYLKEIDESKSHYKIANREIEFVSINPMSISEVLGKVTKQYGLDYVIADTLEKSDDDSEDGYLSSDNRKVSYSGNLEGFFDYLELLYNMKFEISEEGIIKVFYYQTKVVNLQQYFDGSDFSSSISIGKGADGSLSGTSSLSVKANSWDRITEFLTSVLGDDGKFTVFEDYSIVTVKAKPDKFVIVDKFFDKIINESKMQLVVDYRVLSVNKSELNQLGFAASLDNFGKFSLSSPMEATNDLLLSNKNGMSITAGLGTVRAQLDAITKQVSQEVMHEGHFVGLPNRAIPLNLTTKTKYISSIEVTRDRETNEEIRSVSVSDLVTGFSMVLVPKILNDGRIQLMSGYSRKQLVSMDGVDGVSLPIVDENESTSTVTMNSGEIRLVSLFKDKSVQKSQGAALIAAGNANETNDRYIAVLVGVGSYKSNSLVSSE